MRVIIDRFEGEYAVCETESRQVINIERSKLPERVQEGDVLIIEGEVTKLDERETELRRQKIAKLAEDLWE